MAEEPQAQGSFEYCVVRTGTGSISSEGEPAGEVVGDSEGQDWQKSEPWQQYEATDSQPQTPAAMETDQPPSWKTQQQLQEENLRLRNQVERKQCAIEARERQLQQLSQQLLTNKQVMAQFQQNLLQQKAENQKLQDTVLEQEREIQELSGQLKEEKRLERQQEKTQERKPSQSELQLQQPSKGVADKITLSWKKCEKAPGFMSRGAATSDGKMAYFNPSWSTYVYAYDSESEQWSRLPDCPRDDFSLVMVKGKLTAIGGSTQRLSRKPTCTNTLLSLTEDGKRGKWVEYFPPMPTRRYRTAAVCNDSSLIVAGGELGGKNIDTVEIMDTEILHWSTATSLMHPLACAVATICHDRLYLMGGYDKEGKKTQSAVMCHLDTLLQSRKPMPQAEQQPETETATETSVVWQRIADVPLFWSTCVTFRGQLLAIGGENTADKKTKDTHTYDPEADSWEMISEMLTARDSALVAVLPGERLVVVGGWGATDTVEIATVQQES